MIAGARFRQGLKPALFVAALICATQAQGKTTGVGDDPALQSGPCYEALVDKNAANPTTAPNRELGAACAAENNDVDKAWARVIRLWGSDSTEIPDYDTYVRPDAVVGVDAPLWLALSGLALAFAVLGAPLRSAAGLLGVFPRPAHGAAVDLAASLALRGIIAAAFVVVFRAPYMNLVGALALVGWTIFQLGRAAPAPRDPASGSLAAHIAEVINDAAGAAAGLVAVAFFAQHSLVAFALGLAIPLAASAPPVIVARRRLRTRVNAALAAAALAAALGGALLYAPPIAGWLGGMTGVNILAPLVLAGLTLLAGLALPRAMRL